MLYKNFTWVEIKVQYCCKTYLQLFVAYILSFWGSTNNEQEDGFYISF